jgi:hypothetical protein
LFVIADAFIGAFAASNRINAYLVQNLSDEARRGKPARAKGRDIESIVAHIGVAHIHNVRVMWLKPTGPRSCRSHCRA